MTLAERIARHDAWLPTLKPGDAVIVSVRSYGAMQSQPGKVVKITPSGLIDVQVGGQVVRYTKHGRERNGDPWHFSMLEEATPERLSAAREEHERRRLIVRINITRWLDYSTATLRAVVAALDAEVTK